MPLQITGLEPGILLDDFAVSEAPLTNLYYLPEQCSGARSPASRRPATGAAGLGQPHQPVVTNSQLVTWQLSFMLESNAAFAATLRAADAGRQHRRRPGADGLLTR